LHRLHLVDTIHEFAQTYKPIVGICLGAQLMLTSSQEFGVHEGLNLLEGEVLPFEAYRQEIGNLKVPHVGWSKVYANDGYESDNTALQDRLNDQYMYFVHSYYMKPRDDAAVLTWSQYGDLKFCSSFHSKNIYAFQFHPEKSCQKGVEILKNVLGAKQLIKS